jgi:uncharacterized protein (TIGR03382 family)
MKLKRFLGAACATLAIAACSSVDAALFFSDAFSYPNGDLTVVDGTGDNVSGGLWTPHSGTGFPPSIEVIGGQAQILNSGSEDANRVAPGGDTTNTGEKWYFAALVTVNDRRATPSSTPVNNDYFIHFKDSGTANFTARTYLDDPNVAGNGYTFGFAATTGGQTQQWPTDFAFGTKHLLVASYAFDTGVAELWVDPVNESSPKLTESTAVSPGFFINSLALRQDFLTGDIPNNQILIDAVALGDTFADVVQAVPEPAGALMALAGLATTGLVRRRR